MHYPVLEALGVILPTGIFYCTIVHLHTDPFLCDIRFSFLSNGSARSL